MRYATQFFLPHPPGGWNDPCDADYRTSKEVAAMISTTMFLTILFSLELALAIMLWQVTLIEPVKVLKLAKNPWKR
jgi:hypothetical protein